MGLDVSVGLLGAFLEDEADEGFRPYTEDVAAVNATLRAAGLAPFTEPPPDGIEPSS